MEKYVKALKDIKNYLQDRIELEKDVMFDREQAKIDVEALEIAIKLLKQPHRNDCRDWANAFNEVETIPPTSPQSKEDIAKAFQFGVALGFGKRYNEIDRVMDEIKKVFTPEQKTAYWVEENIDVGSRKIFCSECGCPPPFEYVSDGDVYSANGYGVINKTKFCPNCGAKMIEPQENEIQE